MPGLVKIGRTTRNVEQRANELWQTGVPTPFVVEHYQLFPNCVEAEADIHETFLDQRECNYREFFRVPIGDVVKEVDALIAFTIRQIVEIYAPDLCLVEREQDFALNIIQQCADRIGTNSLMVGLAANSLPDETMWNAVEAGQRRIVDLRARGAAS